MKPEAVFEKALGLRPPWRVVGVRLSSEEQRLDITIDFPRGSSFCCPECVAPGAKAYDSQDEEWCHLGFFQYGAYLHARVPRVTCPRGCGTKKVKVPWARPGSGFTLLFEALTMALVREMPVAAVAKLPARLIAVCVHKPTIRDRSTFQLKDVLYFYAVRYLLERVSWLARDAAVAGEGYGRARLVFSERTHMSYSDLFTYLDLLKRRQKTGEDVRIAFPALCLEREKIKVIQSYKQAGLQLVDAWVGAAWNGLEQDKYGNREARYAQVLSPLLYRHRGAAESYGIKIIPDEAVAFVDREAEAGRLEAWWRKN